MHRPLLLLIPLAFALSCTPLPRGQQGVDATSTPASTPASWVPAGPGIHWKRFNWPSGTGESIPITAVRAPASRVRIVTGKSLYASQWRSQSGAVAAINGGFFDDAGESLGLRVSGGAQRSPLHPADWGVFFVRDNTARIVHTRDYAVAVRASGGAVSEAVQCGPRLVVDGRATKLKPQEARRSGIGIDGQGRVILATADGSLPFSSWARLWASPDGLHCPYALNLDGGPSTQLSLRTEKARAEIGGSWTVPDAVVIR